ncbi:MAG: dethiobiotin synthase [Steroidobacteraceae bacterium]
MTSPPQDLHPLLRQSCFVAGTDTGVGKTWVCVQILQALAAAGCRAAGMKPVAAGAVLTGAGWRNDDALALQAASGVPLSYEMVNPVCLPRPTAPHLAAIEAGARIEIPRIVSAYDAIRQRSGQVIVEGAGGWLAPIGLPPQAGTPGPTMQEVALALGLPVVMVVGIRLGALSHALLTAAAVERSGLPMLGWVANLLDADFADADAYVESLQQRLAAPLLGRYRRELNALRAT